MASSCSLARSLVSPDAALARDWYLLRHQSPWGASDGGRAYRLVRPAEDSHLRYETFQAPPPATVYAEPFPGPAVPSASPAAQPAGPVTAHQARAPQPSLPLGHQASQATYGRGHARWPDGAVLSLPYSYPALAPRQED